MARGLQSPARMTANLFETAVPREVAEPGATVIDPAGLRQLVQDVGTSLGRLCDAIELADGGSEHLARHAFFAVLALAQLLDGAESDDRRIQLTLDRTRAAVAELLVELAPHAQGSDRAIACVVLEGPLLG